MIRTKKPVVFSDFDGTITECDVIVMIMEKFAPPEWVNLKDKILYERTVTLKDGVERLFSMLLSSQKKEIISYVKEKAKLREGFGEFLDFCEKENIEFNVLSGGLDFHIYPVLEKYVDRVKVFCNNADFSEDRIKVKYNYLPKNCNMCGDCGCCKIEIIENYPEGQFIRILIGDSLSDLAASKVVDIVFARGDLIKYLEQERISYISFEDFHEVKKQLQQRLLQKI